MSPRIRALTLASLAPLTWLAAAAPTPSDLPSGGLAVIAGAGADAQAIKLAAQGRWLVRVIAPRQDMVPSLAKATAALHPLVTVSEAATRLPFAADTVNAVLLGAGATISAEEAHRVLAPGGVLLSETGGAWRREVEPDDPRYAPWTHWQADAHGSGVSQDTAVAPSTSFRWWGQNMVGSHIRTISGVVGTTEDPLGMEAPRGQRKPSGLHGRDVFSGVPLWYRAGAVPERNYRFRTAFVAHPLGFIHVQGGNVLSAVRSDLRTGEVRATYDLGTEAAKVPGDPHLVVWRDTLIYARGSMVAAFDIPTGRRLWQKELEKGITKLITSRDGTKIFIQESDKSEDNYLRWGSYSTAALSALSLADGKQLWRSTELADQGTISKGKRIPPGPGNGEMLSELIEADGVLYGFDQVTNIGGNNHGDLFAIDIATGKLQWHFLDINGKDPKHQEYGKHGPLINNVVFWNGGLWAKTRNFSLTEPTVTAGPFQIMGGNDRCVRYAGSANFLISGFTSYVGKDFTSYQTGLTRGNCSMPNYASFGSILTATDETCSCYNGPRGQVALIPPIPVQPIPAANRLVSVPPLPADAPATLPDTPLTQDWIPWPSLRFFADHKNAGPVTAGDLTLRVDVQRHLITAHRGPEETAPVAWRFRADGRVFTAPTVGPGGIYVAGTAGTITCLDPVTGTPRWRFLAAPMQAEFVVNGQLESRWPVYNTVLHEGLLYAAAGRHAETDDGIWLWALDPATGAVRKSSRLFVPITVLKPGETTPKGHPSRFRGEREVASTALLCGGVAIEEGRVVLVSRWWNKSGSRPTNLGYWKAAGDSKKGIPDFSLPAQRGFPLDLAAWDGQVINPIAIAAESAGDKK